MKEIFNEITHLEPLDIFYVGDRHKTYFEYPAHCHEVFELNAAGVVRTIGDSHEQIGDLDLVLITGSKLVHIWEQGTCPEQDIHEITIHIDPDIFRGTLMDKRALASIRASVIRLFNLLYRLSLVEDAHELSSSSFVDAKEENEDERVRQVKEFIAKNYMNDIGLKEMADLACMAPESFSRFFRNKTGRTPNRYLIDYRLGIAARLLLTTQHPVSEIGFSCGFNTLSHFNRLFRESKGCTPSEFRERF